MLGRHSSGFAHTVFTPIPRISSNNENGVLAIFLSSSAPTTFIVTSCPAPASVFASQNPMFACPPPFVFTINTDFFSPLARAATARARGTTTRVRDAAVGAPQTRLREENCAAKPLVSHSRVRDRRFFPPSLAVARRRVLDSRRPATPRRWPSYPMPRDAAVRDDARAFATPRDARDARDGARRDAPAPRARRAREREPWRARVAMRRVGRPLVIAIAARDRARARDRGRGDETIEPPVIDDIDIDVRTPTHPWYRGRIFSIGHPFCDPRGRASFGMIFSSPDRRFAEPREVR